MLKRLLHGSQRGAGDYADAFIGPDQKLRFGPTAPEILANRRQNIPARKTATSSLASPISMPRRRVDAKDIGHQIAWFRAQGMVKGDFDADAVIDRRYAIPLPE
jgi:hypothetical protein